MREFQESRRFRDIFFSRPVFVLFLCAAILLAVSLFGVYKKSQHANLRNEAVEKELSDLEQRKKNLEAGVGQSGTQAGIEKELRKRFNIKRPDEEFVVILENIRQLSADQSAEDEKSFFKKFLDFFR